MASINVDLTVPFSPTMMVTGVVKSSWKSGSCSQRRLRNGAGRRVPGDFRKTCPQIGEACGATLLASSPAAAASDEGERHAADDGDASDDQAKAQGFPDEEAAARSGARRHGELDDSGARARQRR